MRVIFLHLFAVFLSASLVVDAMPLPLVRAQAQAQAGTIEARAPKIKTSTKPTTKVAVPAVPVKVAVPAPPPVKVVTPAAPLPIKVTTPPPPPVKVTTPPPPPPVKQGTNGAGTTGNPTAGGAIGAGSGTGIGNGQTGSTGGVIPANGAGTGTGANTKAAGGVGSITPAQPAAPAVDSCPTQTTCSACVAAKDAEGKTCVFKFSAGVITGTCSSAKTAKGPALSLVKDQAKCVTGESTQLAAAEKAAKDAAVKLRKKAEDLFLTSQPTKKQGQSIKDHIFLGPNATPNSGRHLLTKWDAAQFPQIRDSKATFDDSTGVVELNISSIGDGKPPLKTVFNNEASNTLHPGVWSINTVSEACITAIAATLKTQGQLLRLDQRPGGIVVTNPKGVNVCITVALETCFPSKLGAVTGAPGSVC